ncbi:uncharacterized protein LOC115048369 isoform X2 [Echeneis naucrates]|uniref:uncharacterized protein LOC115048369 isoform X2 n=1 Tax=Echeneis naucrates TaxID=173247 RepID=UPI001113626C|nr:uncharacterized protein LOC115048369 isoform X2 [Echeneis naucrates]
MIVIYICFLPLLAPSVEMTPLITHGHVGKNVSFTCTGWSTWFNIQNNVKYICRSPCLKDNDIIIKAAFGKSERKGRLYIFNKGNSLTVTLTDLKPSDSQTFVCGIERFFKDSFQEVKLNVTADLDKTAKTVSPGLSVTSTVTDSPFTSSSRAGSIINIAPSKTSLYITMTTASETSGSRTMPYLVTGVIMLTIMLIALTILRETVKRQLLSSTDCQQDGTQLEVEYDEIRTEAHLAEEPLIVVCPINSPPDTDLNSLGAIYSNCQNTTSTVLSSHAKSVSLNSSSKSRVSPEGSRAERRDAGPENDAMLYSLLQLPKQPTDMN